MSNDKPKPTRAEAKAIVKKAIADAKDTPSGNLGISTDDAIDAIKRGKDGAK